MAGFEIRRRTEEQDSVIELNTPEGSILIRGSNEFVLDMLSNMTTAGAFRELFASIVEGLTAGEIAVKLRAAGIDEETVEKFDREPEAIHVSEHEH